MNEYIGPKLGRELWAEFKDSRVIAAIKVDEITWAVWREDTTRNRRNRILRRGHHLDLEGAAGGREPFKMERRMLLSEKEAFGVLAECSFGKAERTQATVLCTEEKAGARKERQQVWAPPGRWAVKGGRS